MNTTANNVVSHSSDAKTHALVAYILMTIGMFTAIPILIGAVWAIIKKGSAFGTIYWTHYVNATRTFWWSIFWTIIGCILVPAAGVGLLVLGAVWLWALYRLINGLVKIVADEIYPL